MLRLMLDSHPQLAITPETHFLPRLAELCASADDPAEVSLQAIGEADRWPSFELDPEALRQTATAKRCSSRAAASIRTARFVMAGLVPAIHVFACGSTAFWNLAKSS